MNDDDMYFSAKFSSLDQGHFDKFMYFGEKAFFAICNYFFRCGDRFASKSLSILIMKEKHVGEPRMAPSLALSPMVATRVVLGRRRVRRRRRPRRCPVSLPVMAAAAATVVVVGRRHRGEGGGERDGRRTRGLCRPEGPSSSHTALAPPSCLFFFSAHSTLHNPRNQSTAIFAVFRRVTRRRMPPEDGGGRRPTKGAADAAGGGGRGRQN